MAWYEGTLTAVETPAQAKSKVYPRSPGEWKRTKLGRFCCSVSLWTGCLLLYSCFVCGCALFRLTCMRMPSIRNTHRSDGIWWEGRGEDANGGCWRWAEILAAHTTYRSKPTEQQPRSNGIERVPLSFSSCMRCASCLNGDSCSRTAYVWAGMCAPAAAAWRGDWNRTARGVCIARTDACLVDLDECGGSGKGLSEMPSII